MAGTIIADVIQSDQSYPSSINIASPVIISNTFAFPAGTVSAPAFFPTGDTNTGIFFPAADTMAFAEGGVEAMRIDSSGNVGIGTTSPGAKLGVGGGAGNAKIKLSNAASGSGNGDGFDLDFTGTDIYITNRENGFMAFENNGSERMRITSSGNVGIGTTSPGQKLQVVDTNYNFSLRNDEANFVYLTSKGLSGTTYGGFVFKGIRDSDGAEIERARITSDGYFLVHGLGTASDGNEALQVHRNGAPSASFARQQDGTIINFRTGGTSGAVHGTISISGVTTSYNAFAGSHWSQLSDGSKPEILRGTVMESINQMVEWPNEPPTERLCRVKVSDTAGSKKVYGVFMDWDNDWTATNDMYVTAVGAFVCRVNANVVVQEGDLLESNGDGTARVQADDIIRSSTIGKVTCTEKTHQYDDGSYCVPTVLYCG